MPRYIKIYKLSETITVIDKYFEYEMEGSKKLIIATKKMNSVSTVLIL
jgi:hypothetical protein